MILKNVVAEFLIYQEVNGNSIRTLEYYTLTLGYFMDFLGADRQLRMISLSDLHAYYYFLKNRNITRITLQTYIRSVRAFLNWCYAQEYMPQKLTEKFLLPRAEQKVFDVLTDYEIQKLFSCFDLRTFHGVRNWCICALMLDSGLRKSEVVSVHFCHFRHTDSFLIVQGKGSRQRRIPLGVHTRKNMAKYVSLIPNQGSRFLFMKSDGSPITGHTVTQLFRKLKTETGITRLHPHLLRHTFATCFIENGGDVFTLQQILGHTTLDMSRKYTHLGNKSTYEKFRAYSPLDNMKKPPY